MRNLSLAHNAWIAGLKWYAPWRMAIYTVYVALREGASPDDYLTLKRVMLKEFRVGPITPAGQTPVYFSPLFSPLPLIPLREHLELRIKESVKPDHPIVRVIEIE
jgi:hypothetical protein